MKYSGRIDVHHHLIPPAFEKALSNKGIQTVPGARLPTWTSEESLDVMQLNGIQTAILSLSSPGVYFGDVNEAVSLARVCNEYAAQLKRDNPGILGFFAVLPMPFPDLACSEAIYALDVLNADGIILMASSDGVFLGDPQLNDLMAELNRRKTVVFEHPNIHARSNALKLNTPGFFGVESLCETTSAAINLILTGTMETYPDIKWILSHAGGFLPYVAWRISLGDFMPGQAQKAPRGILHYIKQFYYDTALSSSPYAMAALLQLVEPSHILFGSDFPFAPTPVVANEVESLEKVSLLTDEVKYKVNRGNAINLFPQYRRAQDASIG
jgi:predicted TIM-barrel fold metal-dependent hydrolase